VSKSDKGINVVNNIVKLDDNRPIRTLSSQLFEQYKDADQR